MTSLISLYTSSILCVEPLVNLFLNLLQRGLAINTHMDIKMLTTDSGFYQLHVDGRLLLHTRAKRTVEHYLSEAHSHTSSERYVISVSQPYRRTSPDDASS